MTKILGNSIATADQMAAYLLSVNPLPQIYMDVKQFCQLFLDVASKEGVRGDILFAQSCKETGHFKYGGTVVSEQNNYAGLGTINTSTRGAYFPDEETGILAQAQHAKGYATTNPLNCKCVDERYELLAKYGKLGTAENWEDLGGKWAVPGYSTKLYASLEDANNAKDSYGYQIIKIYEKILKMPKEEINVGKIIALDAGHGINTAGKRCLKSLDPDQTREWWLNDRIMDIVEARLSYYDCKVLRVGDTTGKKDISLTDRVKAANNAKADIYISMHHNAGLNGRSGGGTVVYYYSSDPKRPIQAKKLYCHIVNKTKLVGNRSQKVIMKAFTVIQKTSMPAFLVENGFMDSPSDVPIILSDAHAQKTAEGVVNFLVEILSLTKKTLSESTPTKSERYYPAYTGKKATLSVALKEVGVDYSYAYRCKIAKANNITGYRGTAAQNTQMYNLLVAGMLKRAE